MGTSFHGGVVGKGGGSYAGVLCVEEGSGTGVSPYRGPVGEHVEVGPSTGNFKNSLKDGSGYGASPSTGALLGEPGGGGLLCWVMKGRLWRRASLFMGAQLGKLEWAHLPGTLRDGWNGLWRWSISPYGSSVKRTGREGSVAGDPEG
jgi:hypothetical protein